MSSSSKTVLFTEARPEEGSTPAYSTSKWSYFPSSPMQITSSTPRLFVSSDFGTGEKQEDLKEKYLDGNPDGRHVIMYIDVPDTYDSDLVREFQESFEEVATNYVTQTLHPTTTKGKKRGPSLTLSPLLSENSKGGKSFKVKVLPDVLKDMHASVSEEHRGENELALPRDSVFKFLIEITGVWHNSSQYGFTVKLRRAKWVKTTAVARSLKPQDYEFVEEEEEEKEEEEEP